MKTSYILLALALGAASASAQNLVVNGNFEGGNVGFTSGYTYAAPPYTGHDLDNPATYTVGTDSHVVHSFWSLAADHTTGSGNFMIVNGDNTVPLATVWASAAPIALTLNTNYFFEAFVANLDSTNNPGGDPALTFKYSTDGGTTWVSLGTQNFAGDPINTWEGVSTNFNSGSATSVLLELVNAQTAFTGNDFGVDDINFSTTSEVVPEPSTWAGLAAAVVGLGLMVRSRRSEEEAV